MRPFTVFFMLLLALTFISFDKNSSVDFSQNERFIGAWESKAEDRNGLWIITEKHFSITFYKANEFEYTEGGEWTLSDDGKMEVIREYHTQNKDIIGISEKLDVRAKGNTLTMGENSWKRIDNGSPGKLAGAWLITGRYRDGKLSESTPGVRRTMKILSGTKFQWIAYNIETKEFFGTGGGSYTTKGGKYTENIEFFSRDNSRVGASLQFDFKLEDGKWRHSGKSSKGDPLDEIWTKREVLGI